MFARSPLTLAWTFAWITIATPVWGQPLDPGGDTEAPNFVPGEVIVKLRAPEPGPPGAPRLQEVPAQRLEALRSRVGARRVRAVAGIPRAPRLSERARARLGRRHAVAQGAQAPGLAQALSRIEQRLGGFARVGIVEFSEDADVEMLAAILRADPDVEYAQPNYLATAFFVPNDPFFSSTGSWGQAEDDLWGLKLIDVETAWGSQPADFTNAGEGVVVAVVDTGLDIAHPDIAANVWVNTGDGAFPPEIPNNGIDEDNNGYIDDVNGFDFSRSRDMNGDGDYNDPGDLIFPDPIDQVGHGTHVAGTIGAVGNNGFGVVGVAPRVEIMPVRGLGATGSGTSAWLAAAIVYATLNDADVINNSWGCLNCPSNPLVEDAVELAHDLDAVVVFSAGNSSDNAAVRSPQNMSETIAVSALTPTDELTSFSSFGPLVDVGAPGGGVGNQQCGSPIYNILSLSAAGAKIPAECPSQVVAPGYLRLAGTSMSSPHAAGVAALLRGFNPALDNEQVRQILRLASDPIATTSPFAGYGRVNARKVIESTINAAVLLETPLTQGRELEGVVDLEGFARGPNLQNVQVWAGAGLNPTSFEPVPTTRNVLTGSVSATLDTAILPDGYALLRLSADDGVRTYESTTTVLIDNLHFVEPAANSKVSGEIDVVVNTGAPANLQRVVVTYENALTGQTETLLDTTDVGSPQLTTTLDTLSSIDSIHLNNVPFLGGLFTPGNVVTRPTLMVEATYVVDGQPVQATETVTFQIDNDTITSPALGARFGSPSPFTVTGTALHRVRLQAGPVGGSWTRVGKFPPGSFSVTVDPATAGLDLERDNRMLRLVADINGDGRFKNTEQTALDLVLIDPDLGPAWPQSLGQTVGWAGVTIGDIDGVYPDETVVTVSGDPFGAFDPVGGIYAFDGDGTLNTDVLTGASVFPEPACNGNRSAIYNVDGLAGLEMVWASFGQLGAISHDGQVPSGFAPQMFDGELYPCRPPLVDLAWKRAVVQTRVFDETHSLGGPASNLLENRILAFGTDGAVAAEVDKGPGRNHLLDAALADVDADGSYEIVTYRYDLSNTVTMLIYDAATLALENEFPAPDTDHIDGLMVGDLDGQPGLEIVVRSVPSGLGNLFAQYVYAFFNDGTQLPGSPVLDPGVLTRALGDLDGDGDAEILTVSGFGPSTVDGFNVRITAYDFDGSSLVVKPGWPHVFSKETFAPGAILVGNIDDDPAQEVLYFIHEELTYDVAGTPWPVLTFSYVGALDADGTPWKGGWTRAAPNILSMALGTVSHGPELDLALTSTNAYQNNPYLPGYNEGEVLVYPLEGETSWTQWSHRYGNAQHTNAITRATPPACNDGVDNDGDGLVDHPADPGCLFETSETESPACDDGLDNDGDGLVDFAGGPNGEAPDPQCAYAWWATEDYIAVCGLGFELVLVIPALMALRRRCRGRAARD